MARNSPETLKLTRHQQHALFLKGALDAVVPTYLPPAHPDALRHFMDGANAVASGYVRITDPAAMKEFILDVEAELWPRPVIALS